MTVSERDKAAGELWRLAQCAELLAAHEHGELTQVALDERGKVIPSRASLDRVARENPDLVSRAR